MSHSKVSFKVGITIISHRNVVCLKKGIWAYAADKEILEYITNEHEAEVDVSLEFPDFFYDPMDVSNLISGSSAFSKSILCIWKFLVDVLLKPSLKDFEHNLASIWNECNCMVAWTFFGIAFIRIRMKSCLFQSYGHCWVFQICWHFDCRTSTASSFRIWNTLDGIP